MSTTVHAPIALPADDTIELQRSLWQATLHFCRREPLGTFGMVIVLIMAVTGLSAELIAPYSPTANDFAAMTEAPSWTHWLGTDQFGRDLLSRIIFGARTALIVGLDLGLRRRLRRPGAGRRQRLFRRPDRPDLPARVRRA